jgi:alkylation response protein AidB-like acyl-CoA dehydrogenase
MATTDATGNAALLAAARALRPQIQACADQIEQERQLPPPLVDALAAAGLFKLTVPKALGGAEADADTLVRVIEAVASVDGSTGWCLMVPTQDGMMAGYFDEETAREIFGRAPQAYVALVVAPVGRAVVVDGGYRVTGRWRYASGCRHATWLGGRCVVSEGQTPIRGPDGAPLTRDMVMPAADCHIIDTWHVTGLRGTGSHDFVVEDVFVPQARSRLPGMADPPRHAGTLYAFGIGVVPITFAAVSLGIARGAIDAFIDLLTRPGSPKGPLRESALVHAQLGQAETQLRAVRALLFETVHEVWEAVQTAGPLTAEQRTVLTRASAHAAFVSAQVVEALWYAHGSSSIFTSNPLERRFRDAHTAAQRFSASVYVNAGQTLLGLDAVPRVRPGASSPS